MAIIEPLFVDETALPETPMTEKTRWGSSETETTLSRGTRMGITTESFKRRTAQDGNDHLTKFLSGRHLNMIAVGGCIGAGVFVGSGGALATGGPGALALGFLIIGIMVFNVIQALGELAVMYPISGGFYTYASRFISPSWGFAMGWLYCFQWAVVLPLEITVASEVVRFWNSGAHVSIWISSFLALITLINIFGVRGYGEGEFFASSLKLSTLVIFTIIGLVLDVGGGPQDGLYSSYWGARLWQNPGAFRNGFRGFCSVFVTAAFAFAGTELVGLAAAEARNPLKSLPRAVKLVSWRVILTFLALLFVGLLVSSDDGRLFGSGKGFTDTTASPFVIVASDAALKGFDSFVCAVIVVSVISIGNAGVYGGSRTLTALAEQGYAPKIFSYVDKAGRPLPATALMICCGGLAYVNVAAAGQVVFSWLLAICGLAALFTWGSICFAHIRFRQAWKQDDRSLEDIPFRALLGASGSWFSLGFILLVVAAQIFVAIKPPGGGTNDAKGFFQKCLTLPVVLFFWTCGYLLRREGWVNISDIDLSSGRREVDWEEHFADKQRRRTESVPRRILRAIF